MLDQASDYGVPPVPALYQGASMHAQHSTARAMARTLATTASVTATSERCTTAALPSGYKSPQTPSLNQAVQIVHNRSAAVQRSSLGTVVETCTLCNWKSLLASHSWI